jgi:hypothetical protein
MTDVTGIALGGSSNDLMEILSRYLGRDITQAVGRRLSTAVARVRAQFMSCGISGGQSGTGAGFLRVLCQSFH